MSVDGLFGATMEYRTKRLGKYESTIFPFASGREYRTETS
jgi:hypothetical protein